MLTIRQAIAVEGRYDQNKLAQLVDALIVPLDGFGIFRDQGKLQYLRRLARERGLIILTDSDGAGFVIRNYLKGSIPAGRVLHAYIPDIRGKERRKDRPGKEGKLGVEGMRPEVLLEVLRRAGATFEDAPEAELARVPITKQDLYLLHLTGWPDSAARRAQFKQTLGLPEHLSTNGLLDALNAMFDRDELIGD